MPTKWEEKIGELYGNKQIVEFVELKKFRHGSSKAMFKWQCLRCLKIQGPSQYGDIKRYPKSNCCAMARDPSRYGYRTISGARMRWMQQGAKKRNLNFTVSSEYLWDLYLNQNRTCPFTGRELSMGAETSLDRIDSSQGYVEGNVQWVYLPVNRAKSNSSDKDFIDLCIEIAEFQKRKGL